VRRGARIGLGAVVLALLGGLALLASTLRYGFSARDEPTRIEHVLARAMRHYGTPADLRGRTNPVPLTPEVLAEARAHFADHCAQCHGNNGRGDTAIGRNFYPKAPDMTHAETQSQSDGALFATIENGVRLTAMPAWGDGTAGSAHASWTLVHFIRHLPKITEEEVSEMEKLNPRTHAEWAQLQEGSLLAGKAGEGAGEMPPAASPASKPHHH
jgi:mono/diheme cytochrome c family protein